MTVQNSARAQESDWTPTVSTPANTCLASTQVGNGANISRGFFLCDCLMRVLVSANTTRPLYLKAAYLYKSSPTTIKPKSGLTIIRNVVQSLLNMGPWSPSASPQAVTDETTPQDHVQDTASASQHPSGSNSVCRPCGRHHGDKCPQ
ncbi:hypothetical protein BaRGS_00003765 [Batillaria attramentaria]|uniref:Uncharacterized protein n=1 Tax=Batillaria attramentaria TaxID=370345 RepID=A0ABD0LZ05_9CAEN